MPRNDRAALAEETLRIIAAGEYRSPGGTTLSLAPLVAAARAGTRLYDLAVVDRPLSRRPGPTQISVTAETTCEAIVRMECAGGGALAALNFASAKNPGGGFLGGAQAQEEALARSSALYPCLLTQPSYYERNRAQRSALYLDLAIFSPAVPFFRADDGTLLERIACCSIVTAPAPNAGAVLQNQPDDAASIEPTLRRRAELVLAVAAAEKIERLILGAWGCGVFRNDPALVARVFAELLLAGGRFHDVFGEIVFAIFDRSPGSAVLGAFQTQFAGCPAETQRR